MWSARREARVSVFILVSYGRLTRFNWIGIWSMQWDGMKYDASYDGEDMETYTYSLILVFFRLPTRVLNHDVVQIVERPSCCDSPCTLS